MKSSTTNYQLPTTNSQGLTMIETLIVLGVLGLLAVIFLNYFNPLEKRGRALDARRKSDLNRLSVALEDYYGDHDCYPTELLCTPISKAEELKPYLGLIPCDPATHRSYYYEPESGDCPQYYRIYTNLYWRNDPDIERVGCSLGCGPSPAYAYNYGVSSPNVGLEGKGSCTNWCACQGTTCNDVNDNCCADPDHPHGCGITSPKCYCCENGVWCGTAGCP